MQNITKLEIVYVPVGDIIPYDKNPRKNDKAVPLVKASIEQFGFKVPIVLDENNVVVCGHTRLLAAKEIGMTELPCVKASDLTPEQIRAFRLADNKVSEAAEWDMALLGEELAALPDFDFGDFGFTDLDFGDGDKSGLTDEDAVPDAPEEPVSRRGEVYALGPHRLMCGDSTKQEDVATLVGRPGGGMADVLITDPPYNVAYVGSNDLTIANDDMDEPKFEAFLSDAFKCADGVLRPGGAIYIWHSDTHRFSFEQACRNALWRIRQTIIWVKNSFVLCRQDYQWQHEACLYGWKDGAAHYFTAARDEPTVVEDKPDLKSMKAPELREMVAKLLAAGQAPSSVIHENKPARNGDHPTMKPVALIARLVRNSSQRGEIVLDIFGGSGTTLIACEQLGRVCRTMELDPKYCDVIRRRWAEYVHGEGCDWQSLTPVVAA